MPWYKSVCINYRCTSYACKSGFEVDGKCGKFECVQFICEKYKGMQNNTKEQCIAEDQVCDGRNDCDDGSDELPIQCVRTTTTTTTRASTTPTTTTRATTTPTTTTRATTTPTTTTTAPEPTQKLTRGTTRESSTNISLLLEFKI